MRKRYRVLILAAVVAAVMVPFAFALSLEPAPMKFITPAPAVESRVGPVMLDITHRSTMFQSSLPVKTQVPDSAGLLLLGAVLIGAAIAVRRAS